MALQMVINAEIDSNPLRGTVRMERISGTSGSTSLAGTTLRRKLTTPSARLSLPKKPARAVRKIRNGKTENTVRKAMLPASGIASSANSR